MLAYCTKYALTDGITRIEGEVAGQGMFFDKDANYYYSGKDWHMTLEFATEKAEDMRQHKIKSLKKSLSRMEAITFEEK